MGGVINSSAEILPRCLSSSFVLCTKHRIIMGVNYAIYRFGKKDK